MTESNRHDAGEDLLCVGSYTDPGDSGAGITVFAVNRETGGLDLRSTYPAQSPSYLAAHPSLPIVYAVNEEQLGAVVTLRITADGQLTRLAQCSSGGAGPCHCTVTPDGRHLIVSNYVGGSVAVLPLDEQGVARATGSFAIRSGSGPDAERQNSPHPHMAADGGKGTFLLADLGTDEVARYDIAAFHENHSDHAPITPTQVTPLPPGTGPRQVALLPGTGSTDRTDFPQLIVVGELSSDLSVLQSGSTTGWGQPRSTPAQGPGDGPLNYPAHLAVAPGGKFIYVTNRGSDCVTSFAVADGQLLFVDRVDVGAWPRHLAAFGEFLYVAAERGHAIELIRADHDTGSLQHVGQVAAIHSPACVLPIPTPVESRQATAPSERQLQ